MTVAGESSGAGTGASEPNPLAGAADRSGTATHAGAKGLSRRSGILLILVLGGLILLSSVPTWVSARATSALGANVDLAVTGSDAAAGVGAAGLAIAAAGIATGLVGRGGRWVIAIVLGLSGLVVCGSAWTVIDNPTAPALAAAGRLTGVSEITGGADLSVMPWLALILGACGLGLAILIALRSGTWAASSRRHERGAASPAPSSPADALARDEDNVDPSDLWDAQTRGEDEPLQ